MYAYLYHSHAASILIWNDVVWNGKADVVPVRPGWMEALYQHIVTDGLIAPLPM
jgi:hypothetical protein